MKIWDSVGGGGGREADKPRPPENTGHTNFYFQDRYKDTYHLY